jgi:hypothetical protein
MLIRLHTKVDFYQNVCYNNNMTNTKQPWTAHLEEDPDTGDLLLPFPPDMLEQLGWREGDTLTWTVKTNGSIILSKKAKDD